MKQTFVYPYMAQLAQGNELKYSIRSLQKFCNFEFDVVIVGDKPNWFTGKCIDTGKVRNVDFAKAFDINQKMKAIFQSTLVPDNFIYIYDDVYCVNSCELSDFEKVISMDYLPKIPQKTRFGGSTKWMKLLTDTRNALKTDEAWSYETHLPRMFNKGNLELVMNSYGVWTKPLLISTLYYNELFDKPDVVLAEINEYKAGVYQKMNSQSIKALCHGKKWLNNTEAAWSNYLDKFLSELLAEKSIFEI